MKKSFKDLAVLPGKLSCKRGFTLLETLLSVTIFSLLLATLFIYYCSALRCWARESSAMDLQQNARTALYEITRELRYAPDVEGLDDENVLPLLYGSEGGLQQGAEKITYTSAEGRKCEIAFNEGKRTVTLRIGSGPPNDLAYNVAELEFFRYFPQGTAGGGVSGGIRPLIFVRLKVQERNKGIISGNSYILQSSVRLQNISD